jgi:hypothetical protein
MPGRFDSLTLRVEWRVYRLYSALAEAFTRFFFLRLIQQAQESAKLDYSAARRRAAIKLPISFYGGKPVLCPFHVPRKPPPQKANVDWLDRSLRKERLAHEQVAKLHQEERAKEAKSRKRQRETVSEGEGEKPEKRAKSDQTHSGKEKRRKSSEKKEAKRKEKGEVKGASEAKPLKQGTQDGRTVSVVAVQTTGEVAEERRRRKNAKRIRRRAIVRRSKSEQRKNDKEQESAGGGAGSKEEESKGGASEEVSSYSSSSS